MGYKMPYKFENKQRFTLLESNDARCKWTAEDKERVKHLWAEGQSQRAIARVTGMSRRMVSFVLFPEKEKICREQFKERRKDGRYYDKEAHKKAMQTTRKKKHAIMKGHNDN